jgi:hypothetical protein
MDFAPSRRPVLASKMPFEAAMAHLRGSSLAIPNLYNAVDFLAALAVYPAPAGLSQV